MPYIKTSSIIETFQ